MTHPIKVKGKPFRTLPYTKEDERNVSKLAGSYFDKMGITGQEAADLAERDYEKLRRLKPPPRKYTFRRNK